MRILIVEDQLQMAEQLRKGLEREGYSVLLAHDGLAALDLARTIDHDLMILDWMLPKLDGCEVARRLRQARIGTPILMLTARDTPPDVVERECLLVRICDAGIFLADSTMSIDSRRDRSFG